MRTNLSAVGVVLVLWVGSGSAVFGGGDVPAFSKFCGRAAILGVPTEVPNPVNLPIDPQNPEDCDNGVDDNGDGLVDYDDADCQGDLGPQYVRLKTPFSVVQPVGDSTPARFTGTDRNLDFGGEILINSTGPGERKHSYLRTDDPNRYRDVSVRALVLPGAAGDEGGPIAIRIQGAEGENAHKSYYARVVPGDSVSIQKDNGDGSSTELAVALKWASGEAIEIREYDGVEIVPYQVELSATGSSLVLTVSEAENNLLASLTDTVEAVKGRTVTIRATDAELVDGYIGLRSDFENEIGDAPDDLLSTTIDPSVLDFFVSDPTETADPAAPRILFFSAVDGDIRDNLDYSTEPITPTNYRPYRRSGTTIADQTLANYLRSVGFVVDDVPISSLSAGFLTPEDINTGPWDIWWVPGSGGSSATRGFFREINIPTVFSEHVDGKPEFGGVWQVDNSGNERPIDCAGGGANCTVTSLPDAANEGCETLTTLRVFPEELFGDPDHPIIRGLADENGDIPVSDASQIPLNVGYPFPASAVEGLNGSGFKDIATTLKERGWGVGASETQMGGWPPTEGGVALAGFISPCDGELLLQGGDPPPDQGHTSLIAVEAGSPRTVLDPGLCPEPCEFESRVVFIWFSDQAFHYSTPEALALTRRVALWDVNLLNSPNRSALPFRRGDANGDGATDISDPVRTLNWLFLGADEPGCLDAADADDSETVDITDAIYTLNFLFLGDDPPPPPLNKCFQGCGLDFTPEATPEQLEAEAADPSIILSCNAYDACR